MKNVRMIDFRDHEDNYGHLTPIEERIDIPFSIKRIYYISDVEEKVRRGYHSHRNLEQVLICVSGSVKILVKTPTEEQIFELNDRTKGLYIGFMIWREMYDFSSDAVLLVLSSEYYNEQDYIRNFHEYQLEAKQYFE